MHGDRDVPSDVGLVRRLVAEQYPEWAGLEVTGLPATGTDNLLYRLGTELTVRMPRIAWAVDQIDTDATWLPVIAPRLPVAISTPVAVGAPGQGYPFPWAVHRWLPGTNPAAGDHVGLAEDLAAFVIALRELTDGPPSSRAGPLQDRDPDVRAALGARDDEVDVVRALDAWDEARTAPEHTGPPVWRHADLTPGNLLVDERGRLAAVIDFGPSGLGDPAVDLVPAWRVFRGAARERFLEASWIDEHAVARGRGWALSIAVLELAYYRSRAPHLADAAREALGQVLP